MLVKFSDQGIKKLNKRILIIKPVTKNVWKYCENTFEQQGNVIKLNSSEDSCYKYF